MYEVFHFRGKLQKRIYHQQIFKFRLYKQFHHNLTVFKLLEPKTEISQFII